MNDWWKAPVLQGEENDYGQYDYMIEEIPSNTIKWSWWSEKCDECRKEHRLNLVYTGYFRTLDGWDSMESCECWVCFLKRKVKQPFKALKKKIDKCQYVRKEMRRYAKQLKQCGVQFTYERRQRYKKILSKEF